MCVSLPLGVIPYGELLFFMKEVVKWLILSFLKSF